MYRYLTLFLLVFSILLLFSCKSQKVLETDSSDRDSPLGNSEPAEDIEEIPARSRDFVPVSLPLSEPAREFRGIWIATVVNIDWPRTQKDSWEQKKQEFQKLLDYYKGLNFNAVIVQVRAAGDAFYPSRFAPWSRYLTGEEGVPMDTQEDPLSWMILESHRRGMEFHAWLNPYRATFDTRTELLSPDHDYFLHPDWMLRYGAKYYYDPGLPEVREKLTEIIQEIVQNYDVDAIHFDDYFYPYKVSGQEFPDSGSFQKFKNSGQSLADWRRENVNQLVREVHETIKGSKPWVQFGISPFGVWRNQSQDPEGSPTRAGQTNYDDLYADPLTWMKNGWIDYLIPQLYWSMDYSLASHRLLADWWAQHASQTALYIGNGPYKIRDNSDPAWKDVNEIPRQIAYQRTLPSLKGNAFFSARSLFEKNQDVAELLREGVYEEPGIPPVFEPQAAVSIALPDILEIQTLEDQLLVKLSEGLDPAIRYGLMRSGDTHEQLEASPYEKIWVGDQRSDAVSFSPCHARFYGFQWLDHYGRIVQTQVFENKTYPRL